MRCWDSCCASVACGSRCPCRWCSTGWSAPLSCWYAAFCRSPRAGQECCMPAVGDTSCLSGCRYSILTATSNFVKLSGLVRAPIQLFAATLGSIQQTDRSCGWQIAPTDGISAIDIDICGCSSLLEGLQVVSEHLNRLLPRAFDNLSVCRHGFACIPLRS